MIIWFTAIYAFVVYLQLCMWLLSRSGILHCYSITPFSIESVRKDRLICEMCYFLGWNVSLKCKFIHWLIDLFIVAMKLEFLKILRLVLVNSPVWWVCSGTPEWSLWSHVKCSKIIQRLSGKSLLQSPSTSCNTTYNASFSNTSWNTQHPLLSMLFRSLSLCWTLANLSYRTHTSCKITQL